MDVHIDDMFMFAFCFSQLARDWLLQGLAVAVTGLQAVTTIQAHWFHLNQALPASLTSPLFPFPAGLRGAAAAAAAGLSCRAAPLASAAASAAAGAGAGAASAASAGAAESSPVVSSSGVGPNQSLSGSWYYLP